MDLRRHSSWDEWLGSLSAESLATLLQLRPDVALPPPTSLLVLSTRLTQQRSYRRALHALSRPQLYLLALHAREEQEAPANGKAPEGDTIFSATEMEQLTATLADYALLYPGAAGEYLLPPGLADILPHLPLDLLRNTPLRDCTELRKTIALLPASQRHVLDTLAESGRKGHATALSQASSDHPLRQLLDARLLYHDHAETDTVLLPEDVYCALHHSVAAGTAHPLARPQPHLSHADSVELSGGTSAGAPASGVDHFALFLHTLRELITELDTHPLQALAGGGMGQRELHRLATATQLAPQHIITGVEALAALAIIEEDHTDEERWITTAAADTFLAATPAAQWEMVVRAWWYSPRPWAGTRHERALALHPDAANTQLIGLRRQLLETLTLWPSSIPTATEGDIAALVHWRYPLIPALTGGTAFVDTLQAADTLGLMHAHTLTQVGRAVLAGTLTDTIGALIPAETTSILLQDDHTVLVQGFLSPTHTDTLRHIATVESPGIATMYRISEESIRHAFDTGLSAADIHTFLRTLSVNDVPQSLSYLIDDAARRHGTLRVAPALAVLYSGDPALVRTAVDAPALRHCGLRMVAPTVALADVTPRELHTALQQAGLSPLAEDQQGNVLALRPHRPRPTPANPPHTQSPHPQLSPAQAQEIASRLQAAEDNNRHHGPLATGDSIIPALAEAITKRQEVIVSFVKGTGVGAQLRVVPQGMSQGRLDAVEVASRQPYRFMLHKIRAVRIVTDKP